MVTIFEIFEHIYPNTREGEISRVSCPYRLCPLGAHSDHQFGIISGFALDHGVEMAFCVNPSRVVELDSCNFDGRVQFIIQPDMPPREDWGRYAPVSYTHLIPCKVSLEERMACGVGACVGCAVKTRTPKGEERYAQVCKNGPVFDAKEVVW